MGSVRQRPSHALRCAARDGQGNEGQRVESKIQGLLEVGRAKARGFVRLLDFETAPLILFFQWRLSRKTVVRRTLHLIHYSERNMYARNFIGRTFKMAQLIVEEYVGLEHA